MNLVKSGHFLYIYYGQIGWFINDISRLVMHEIKKSVCLCETDYSVNRNDSILLGEKMNDTGRPLPPFKDLKHEKP